jgi:hypothetical protein
MLRMKFPLVLCIIWLCLFAGACVPSMPSPYDKGHYYAPTVLEVDTNMEIWREEVFGPVVVAIKFEDEEEAIRFVIYSPSFGVVDIFCYVDWRMTVLTVWPRRYGPRM